MNVRQIAQRAAIFWGANLIPDEWGRGRRRLSPRRRTGAFARTGQFHARFNGFGRRLAGDAQATGWEDVAS
jgi:hypothetical protein